MESR
jgi:hypothetical protein